MLNLDNLDIKFISLYEGQKLPNRAHETDAGIDFYVPTFTKEFLANFEAKNSKSNYVISGSTISVYPHKSILIPSGIKVILPHNTALIAFNKSGIATKKQLVVGACVIDEMYRGEVHIHLINTLDVTVEVEENQKIVQFLHIPMIYSKMVQISPKEFDTNTERGENGFGSTG